MVIFLSVLCLLLALIAFGLSIAWPERWHKCVSWGLALGVLSQIVAAAPQVIPK